MKYYRCLDSDCGIVTDEFRRIQIRDGVFKCYRCRGKLVEISEREYETQKQKENLLKRQEDYE